MKKEIFLIITFILFVVLNGYAQKPEVKQYETFDLFLEEQNKKVAQVIQGSSKKEVEAVFGGPIRVQIPKVGKMKPLDKLFKQPEFMNVFKPNTESEVVVLWYFTTPRDQNGVLSKRECTPVILIADKVVGIGWDDFNKARKDGTLR